MGSRAAVTLANELGANHDLIAGIICFAYPLHPPGDQSKLRNQLLEELVHPGAS